MRVHLDTDFAGDPDDACALAMLLGWPDVEIVGITTVADPDGSRAGYVRTLLDLAGRNGIPIASGAGTSITDGRTMGDLPDHDRYWDGQPRAEPPGGDAQQLLRTSVDTGATLLAIGPATNFARLETERPGALSGVSVVMMGGWVDPPPEGFPPWGPERDWNVQCDTRAVEIVAAAAQLTLVPLAVTVQTHLRAQDLPRLRAAGPLGALLARQARAYGEDRRRAELAAAHPRLPDDLLNFHHDPLACAVALGWPGVRYEQLRLEPVLEDGGLRFARSDGGRMTTVAVQVDGTGFAERWLEAIEAAQSARSFDE